MMKLDPQFGVAVFTDGSCDYRDRSGGWAWVAVDAFDGYHAESAFYFDTTVNQMELMAATRALTKLAELGQLRILIYSDSEYVVKGAEDPTRARNKNKTFWRSLDDAIAVHEKVEFVHVKGHNGNEFNELADKLAGDARRKGKCV